MSTLAIDGGVPIRSQPMPLRRLMGRDERAAILSMFERAETQGHTVFRYNGPEEEAYCREFAVSLGEVIVPAVSDPGGVMPVALANQLPVPADCEPGTYNVGAGRIGRRRRGARQDRDRVP